MIYNPYESAYILMYATIAIYTLSLLLIFFYSLAQLNLLINYLKSKKKQDHSPQLNFENPEEIPFVTIQLPVYNELYVMERLLDCISKMAYPREKLEIQVLDDSTDESVDTTAAHIQKLKKQGLDILHIRRTNRSGFKAGALKEGLKTAKGEFIAIFDADFLPASDFLYKTIPYFKDPKIGVVQTRWGHINRDYSILTKIQALALDAHFTLEQVGRNSKGHFINFNGTAGVWRASCIYDAGNWQGDTLTEDLDLSYRAQLKGWQFKYLVDVESPAELPVAISAARSQQFRWNKGGAENFSKMSSKVIHSHLPFKTKVHGILHLLNSTMFLNVLIVGVLSVPMLYIKNTFGHLSGYFYVTGFFIITTVILFICYWHTFKATHGGGFVKFLRYIGEFVTFYAIAMGFSLHNSIAVYEGHMGKKSEFVRTPKFNINSLTDKWKGNKYLAKNISKNTILEGALMLYFLFAIWSAFTVGKNGDFGLLPFHLMLFIGFGFVFFNSISAKA